jgi:hypothetical protein
MTDEYKLNDVDPEEPIRDYTDTPAKYQRAALVHEVTPAGDYLSPHLPLPEFNDQNSSHSNSRSSNFRLRRKISARSSQAGNTLVTREVSNNNEPN